MNNDLLILFLFGLSLIVLSFLIKSRGNDDGDD